MCEVGPIQLMPSFSSSWNLHNICRYSRIVDVSNREPSCFARSGGSRVDGHTEVSYSANNETRLLQPHAVTSIRWIAPWSSSRASPRYRYSIPGTSISLDLLAKFMKWARGGQKHTTSPSSVRLGLSARTRPYCLPR